MAVNRKFKQLLVESLIMNNMQAARRQKLLTPHRKQINKILAKMNPKVNKDREYRKIQRIMGRDVCFEVVRLPNFKDSHFKNWVLALEVDV